MKLYMFPVAPNPTRVRLYLAEKAEAGGTLDVTQVPVNLAAGEQMSETHLARNPLGKLPVLELPDGSHLTESLAIIEYLEELHPDPPMIGSTPDQRARVRELERVAEMAVLVYVALGVHTTRSPLGLAPIPEAAAFFMEMLPKGLERLDQVLSDGRPFLAGGRVSIADCTLAAALQFGRFGQLELPVLEHLARWDEAYRQRPAARSVLVL